MPAVFFLSKSLFTSSNHVFSGVVFMGQPLAFFAWTYYYTGQYLQIGFKPVSPKTINYFFMSSRELVVRTQTQIIQALTSVKAYKSLA